MTRFRTKNDVQTETYSLIGFGPWGATVGDNSPSVTTGSVTACFDSTHKGPPYRSGGPFYLKRHSFKVWPGQIHYDAGNGNGCNGTLLPNQSAHWGLTQAALDGQFSGRGIDSPPPPKAARAYNRARPGNAQANLATAVGEVIKDGIPGLPLLRMADTVSDLKKRTRVAKEAGSEYLNVVFGWIPLLNDVRAALKLTRDLDKHLKQLARDNGKVIRRNMQLPTEYVPISDTVSTSFSAYMYPHMHAFYYSDTQKGARRTVNRFESRHWFAGAFKYWIPDLGTAPGRSRATRKLYGLDVTPSMLWELTPWSWLIDWHSNVGEVLSNMSGNAAENLVSLYGYHMNHFQNIWEVSEYMVTRVGSTKVQGMATSIAEYKQRFEGNPYGFGADIAPYSGKQWAIMAALGLAKS